MKAMIFAAGIGSRLRPLTDRIPKALVSVGGVPMLQRVILNLKAAGFSDITVNIHHFGEQIIEFLNANGNFGVDIHISDERGRLLDTGGGILKARRYLDGAEPFLVHNVDIATDADLPALWRQHARTGALATLLVCDRNTSRKLVFGDDDGVLRMCGWTNTQTGETKPQGLDTDDKAGVRLVAFNGIHVISPQVFDYMGAGTPWQDVFSITPFYIDVCRRAVVSGCVQPSGVHWFDIGKPETLRLAESYFTAP